MQPKYTQLAIGERAKGRTYIERICPVCGGSFAVQPCALKNGRGRTCSPACQYKSNSAKCRDRVYPKTGDRLTITCKTCGDGFQMLRSDFDGFVRRGNEPTYCSVRCAHESPEWKKNLGESLKHSERAKSARERAVIAMNADAGTTAGRNRRREQTLRQMQDPEMRAGWEEGIRKRTADPAWRASKHFQRGAAHPRYNGGKTARQVDRSRYQSKVWRVGVFERDTYTCRVCGVKGGYLNAHHIKPWVKFPELRHDISNGATLCVECHKGVHNGSVILETHDHTPDT